LKGGRRHTLGAPGQPFTRRSSASTYYIPSDERFRQPPRQEIPITFASFLIDSATGLWFRVHRENHLFVTLVMRYRLLAL